MSAQLIPFRASIDHAALTDAIEQSRPAFDAEYVDTFIRAFAESDGDPKMWLEDRGIGENYGKALIGPELIRRLCITWVRDEMAVFEACGTDFWYCMHEIASTAYDAE